MTFYTYILQSRLDGRFYYGHCDNLEKRFEKHQKGYVKYTKKFRPWNLVWFKRFDSRAGAYQFEHQLKALKSRSKVVHLITENPCVAGSENLQISDLLDFRDSAQDREN